MSPAKDGNKIHKEEGVPIVKTDKYELPTDLDDEKPLVKKEII